MTLSFRSVFYSIAVIAAFFVFLYFGAPVLIPLAVGLLLSFILYPISVKLEKLGFNRIIAAIAGIFIVVGPLAALFYLFSAEIIKMMSDFSDFGHRLTLLSHEVVYFLNKHVSFLPKMEGSAILEKGEELVKASGRKIMADTVNQTATILAGFIMVIVYTFLFLIYRTGLVNIFKRMGGVSNRNRIARLLRDVQMVGQRYLVGMAVIMGILGTLNSVALLLLGVEHALFFGFLAAFLAIIPYVGTTIGAIVPAIYAFMTHTSYWVPLGVLLSFWLIQLIENNFLSPKIVGGNLNINAFAAIFTLILGGYLWGIAGMALFLPLTAILRVVCGYFDQLRPFGMLLGNGLYEDKPGSFGKIGKMKERFRKKLKPTPKKRLKSRRRQEAGIPE
jgi:predicted PurR-regulated permease PerM